MDIARAKLIQLSTTALSSQRLLDVGITTYHCVSFEKNVKCEVF